MTTRIATRYRVTVNGSEHYHDAMPTDDRLAEIESFITNRGGHATVHECTTTIHPELVGTGRGIELRDRLVFEIEG